MGLRSLPQAGHCRTWHKNPPQKKRRPKPKPSLLVVFATSWSLLNMAHKKKEKKPKPSLLVVFATSWSLLNMAQKQQIKETETEAKPSCGLCHKLVIAEHGTKTKNQKKGNRNRSQAFLWSLPQAGHC